MQLPENLIRMVGLFGALSALALLALLLRWTYGSQRSNPSPPAGGDGYGLLAEVSRVPTASAAAVLRSRLAEQGLRATVAAAPPEDGAGGYRLLVFPADVAAARMVLGRGSLE